jgi:hypothetical protein
VTFNGVEGGFNLHFTADQHGSGQYDGFQASYTEDISSTTGKDNIVQVSVKFDGSGSGDYSAGDGLLSWWNSSYKFNSNIDMSLNGKALPSVPVVLSSIDVGEALLSGSEQYVCTRSTLQLMPPIHGKTMPPIVFTRVSP